MLNTDNMLIYLVAQRGTFDSFDTHRIGEEETYKGSRWLHSRSSVFTSCDPMTSGVIRTPKEQPQYYI